MKSARNIIVTACDSSRFIYLLVGIRSVYENSANINIVVYDLGMTSLQKQILQKYESTQLRKLPTNEYSSLKYFEWKIDILKHFEHDIFLYLDLPNLTIQKHLANIFQKIDKYGYFIVEAEEKYSSLQEYSPEIFARTIDVPWNKFKAKKMFGAGIIGMDRRRIQEIIERAYKIRRKGVLNPNNWQRMDEVTEETSGTLNFRYDQTLLNWLFYIHIPKLKVDTFALYCEKPRHIQTSKTFLYRRRHYESITLHYKDSKSSREQVYIIIKLLQLKIKQYIKRIVLFWENKDEA